MEGVIMEYGAIEGLYDDMGAAGADGCLYKYERVSCLRQSCTVPEPSPTFHCFFNSRHVCELYPVSDSLSGEDLEKTWNVYWTGF